MPHPIGDHVGLVVRMDPDNVVSVWAEFNGQSIVVRTTPGETLRDVTANGGFYVTTPLTKSAVEVRRFGDDKLVVEAAEVIGYDGMKGEDEDLYGFTRGGATFVTTDALVVSVGFDEWGPSEHLLVSANDLSLLHVIDYGVEGWREQLVPAARPGRWVTLGGPGWRLWELPDGVR